MAFSESVFVLSSWVQAIKTPNISEKRPKTWKSRFFFTLGSIGVLQQYFLHERFFCSSDKTFFPKLQKPRPFWPRTSGPYSGLVNVLGRFLLIFDRKVEKTADFFQIRTQGSNSFDEDMIEFHKFQRQLTCTNEFKCVQ